MDPNQDNETDMWFMMQAYEYNQQLEEEKNQPRLTRNPIDCDPEDAEIHLMADYFDDYCKYLLYYFRMRYRMCRKLVLDIVKGIESRDVDPLPKHLHFFTRRSDAAGRMSMSVIMKCTSAIRRLAYSNTPDAFDEYLKMGEHIARDCLDNFNKCIINLYTSKYLRKPTLADIEKIYNAHENIHSFSDNSSLFDDLLDDIAPVDLFMALVECEGESIDLSGDLGVVGRVVFSDSPSGNQDMFLDLKGTIYKTTIIPSKTFCVSFGQSEAKIEAIMNDFIQLKAQSNVYEAETMVEAPTNESELCPSRNNRPQLLAGKDSLLQTMLGPEFAAAFGMPEDRMKDILNAQTETTILPLAAVSPGGRDEEIPEGGGDGGDRQAGGDDQPQGKLPSLLA
ncbi:ALP1-like protein [Tanacetum coccineum]